MKIKNIDELLCDDGFLAWYFKRDQASIDLWEARIAHDAEQKKIVEEAILVLETIKIKEENTERAITETSRKKPFRKNKFFYPCAWRGFAAGSLHQ